MAPDFSPPCGGCAIYFHNGVSLAMDIVMGCYMLGTAPSKLVSHPETEVGTSRFMKIQLESCPTKTGPNVIWWTLLVESKCVKPKNSFVGGERCENDLLFCNMTICSQKRPCFLQRHLHITKQKLGSINPSGLFRLLLLWYLKKISVTKKKVPTKTEDFENHPSRGSPFRSVAWEKKKRNSRRKGGRTQTQLTSSILNLHWYCSYFSAESICWFVQTSVLRSLSN